MTAEIHGPGGQVDVTDRIARLLGHVIVDSGGGPDVSALSKEATLLQVRDYLDAVEILLGNAPDLTGIWGYKAGVSGSPALPAGAKVIGIAAHCTAAGSVAINAGDSIPIPANVAWSMQPYAQLTQPTLVFTSTDSYFVEYLT